MRRLALVTVLVLASVCCTLFAACGDDGGCSAVGCGPELSLQIRRAVWEPGTWTLELDSSVYCTWEVSASGDSEPVGCGGGEGPRLYLDSKPEELTVSLSRDGEPIGSRTIRPDYQTSHDECLTCTSADEVVEF